MGEDEDFKGFVAAARKVREILARPMPEHADAIGIVGAFDPWDILPALYGSYSSDFDDCALDVLRELRDGDKHRYDLASEMIREMLCKADLCNYGTSPRGCFPTEEFREILPAVIEKWEAYSALAWGGVSLPATT